MSNALTVETQYAAIDNKQIAYRKIGNGTPIILANRFRGTLDTWDSLFLDLLAETNTVITFDYSGIGYSEGELPTDVKLVGAEVTKIADFLGIDKFIVGGWSYGGIIAQYTTFLFPERVLSTIVIGSNPIGKTETPLSPLFLEKAMIPNYSEDDITTLFFEPKSEVSRIAASASWKRIDQRLDQSKVPSTPDLFQRYFAISPQTQEDKENFRTAYQTLKTPILAISGDNDISFAVENWFPLLQKAPTLQHIIFQNAGHAPHYQYPETATDYIKVFLKNQ
ncbi:alpha/beta hydrolase [Chryseobacterium sp. Ch-15]|uniref:Alpha/beta hydrolase n=1 Tax=Chryseobacterium muglaense TaxID=2893752 RepID=A0A9Q3UYU9_9FLAO|nr:alpha/beta hydrolase [Chryseobacterium muglaense]MBD3903290.1 alpha/beta hydrolase [Chryseobacterium muglaense]MCC9036120.1 alpha/beta hydrolase [Chryseobacterium muglaense]MCM2553304.1 alpha/beta hydrolase [Chryseobacterium muglaense]